MEQMSTVLTLSNEAVYVLLKISAPFLLIALFVGLFISFFQAITQMQEMTLSFVPKILALFGAMWLLVEYSGKVLGDFSEHLFEYIALIS